MLKFYNPKNRKNPSSNPNNFPSTTNQRLLLNIRTATPHLPGLPYPLFLSHVGTLHRWAVASDTTHMLSRQNTKVLFIGATEMTGIGVAD